MANKDEYIFKSLTPVYDELVQRKFKFSDIWNTKATRCSAIAKRPRCRV